MRDSNSQTAMATKAPAGRMIENVASVVAVERRAPALDQPCSVARVEFGDRKCFARAAVKAEDVVDVIEIGKHRRQKALRWSFQ